MKIRPVEAELFHADGWTDRQTGSYDESDNRLSSFSERAYKVNYNATNHIIQAYKSA